MIGERLVNFEIVTGMVCWRVIRAVLQASCEWSSRSRKKSWQALSASWAACSCAWVRQRGGVLRGLGEGCCALCMMRVTLCCTWSSSWRLVWAAPINTRGLSSSTGRTEPLYTVRAPVRSRGFTSSSAPPHPHCRKSRTSDRASGIRTAPRIAIHRNVSGRTLNAQPDNWSNAKCSKPGFSNACCSGRLAEYVHTAQRQVIFPPNACTSITFKSVIALLLGKEPSNRCVMLISLNTLSIPSHGSHLVQLLMTGQSEHEHPSRLPHGNESYWVWLGNPV